MNFGTAKADLDKLAKEEREWWVGKKRTRNDASAASDVDGGRNEATNNEGLVIFACFREDLTLALHSFVVAAQALQS